MNINTANCIVTQSTCNVKLFVLQVIKAKAIFIITNRSIISFIVSPKIYHINDL